MHTLNEMMLFVEVAKTLSFSRAAVNLGIPQSSLSRRIYELEKDLDLRLLNRTTRRIELTEAGRLYFERAKPLIEEAQQIQNELQGRFKQPQGMLRISVPVDLAYEWIAPLLPEFSQRFPAISLDIDVTPRKADLISESFDLVIRAGEQPNSSYIATLLMHVPRYLYASPDYLAKYGNLSDIHDLNQHHLLNFSAETHWQLFHDLGEQIQFTPSAMHTANSLGLLQRLAEQHLGIALLPTLLIKSDAVLTRILPHWQSTPAPIYALTTTRLLPTKSRCFIDFLKEKSQIFTID